MSEHRDSPWRRARCQALWEHQHGLCFHCGRPMGAPMVQRVRHRKRDDAATIEHVLPRSMGGMAAWPNEVAACRACNAAKADMAPLAIQLWRLAWLKGGALAEHATAPAALIALLSARADDVA